MLSKDLPMTTYAYSDNDLVYEVVDVMKLYPEILNNTYWRDANYQFIDACNRLHPYVFDIINDFTRTPFGACLSVANTYMKNRYDEIKWNVEFYNKTNLIYGYVAPLFGTIGLICVLLTLVLIRKNSTLHTPYGIMVFFQCLLMVALLIELSTLEAIFQVLRVQFNQLVNTDINYNYGIFIGNVRIDRFMVYMNQSLSLAIAFLRLLKTFSRFCVLYLEFKNIFTNSFTKKLCIVITASSILSFMPLVAFPEACNIEITISGILPLSTCSRILTAYYIILRIVIAICGFVLGILAVIKFRKYLKCKTWTSLRAKRERTLIIQIFCDLIDFVAIFIPLFLFRFVYLSPYLVSRISPYIYLLNLMANRPVTTACLGHCIDSMITLHLMKKIVNLQRKTENMIVQPLK